MFFAIESWQRQCSFELILLLDSYRVWVSVTVAFAGARFGFLILPAEPG